MPLKKIFVLSLIAANLNAYASTGLLHHKFENNTNDEVYVSARQEFNFLENDCSGVIPAHSTKECVVDLDKTSTKLILNFVKKAPFPDDIYATSNISMIKYANNMFIDWEINANNDKLQISYSYSRT